MRKKSGEGKFFFYPLYKRPKLCYNTQALEVYAPVAQWIEHRIPVPRVGGSSPFWRTKSRLSHRGWPVFVCASGHLLVLKWKRLSQNDFSKILTHKRKFYVYKTASCGACSLIFCQISALIIDAHRQSFSSQSSGNPICSKTTLSAYSSNNADIRGKTS